MRPGAIMPMRVTIAMYVRRSPNCETVFERPKKRSPLFLSRLNICLSKVIYKPLEVKSTRVVLAKYIDQRVKDAYFCPHVRTMLTM
jgi:hypothetical protein